MPLSTKTRLVLFAVHFYFFLPLFRGHFNWWPSNWLATCPNTQTWPVASGQKFIVAVVVSNHSNWLFTATLLPCLCPCVPEFVCTLYSNSRTWSISLIALLIPYFYFFFLLFPCTHNQTASANTKRRRIFREEQFTAKVGTCLRDNVRENVRGTLKAHSPLSV